jgi:hypothetical protein
MRSPLALNAEDRLAVPRQNESRPIHCAGQAGAMFERITTERRKSPRQIAPSGVDVYATS